MLAQSALVREGLHTSTRRLLQGKNVVGSLITRLSDSEEEVVVEAAGSLRCVHTRFVGMSLNTNMRVIRNLCIDGGYEICAEMYNKNILAPLKTFIPKVRPAGHYATGRHLTVLLDCIDIEYPLTIPREPKSST